MEENFIEFLNNLQVDNFDEIETSLNEIAKKLNQKYYDNSSYENYLLVGSMGRNTSIKGESDIDIIYELPNDVFNRFDNYSDNGQSKLLQEIKDILKEKYTSTEIKGDGQVVVISFSKYQIELVPGFKQDDNSYKYPDTHDGGSWKITNPLPEIDESNSMINSTLTYKDICQMIRQWKANNGVAMPGILIDTLAKNFLDDNNNQKRKNKDEYYDLLIEVFNYLKNQDKDRKQWNALGSNQIIKNKSFNFITKASKAYDLLMEDNEKTSNLNELFGNKFPIGENVSNEYGYSETEQFIEELYPVNILYALKIDCRVIQNGFRPFMLSEIISKKIKIKQNRKLLFFISECKVPTPYNIYWKIRNVGAVAISKKCIRGQINKGKETHEESSIFFGPHYVECYIVKNGFCVARERIPVSIDNN